jgi:hypothetical protein
LSEDISLFKEEIRAKVIEAYLYENKSHRTIQKEILGMDAPARGGGFIAMQILHHYGIDSTKKGSLKNNSIEEEYANATSEYKQALDLLKKIPSIN